MKAFTFLFTLAYFYKTALQTDTSGLSSASFDLHSHDALLHRSRVHFFHLCDISELKKCFYFYGKKKISIYDI